MASLLVEHIRAVAHAPHLLQQQHQPVAVALREEVQALPFLQQVADLALRLVVHRHLLLGHGHQQVLVLPRRHLQPHLPLGAAYEDAAQPCLDRVEALVSNRGSLVVGDNVAVAEEVVGTQAELVDELHDRI